MTEEPDARGRLAALVGKPLSPPEEPTTTSLTKAFDPGRPGLKAIAAVAAVVVLAAAAYAWFSRPHAETVAPASESSASAPVTGVVVAVAGKVRFPGLVRLPAGARVADAIEAAGGVLPGTDLSTVNLARKVADGELITVGTTANTVAPGTAADGKVNLNTATAAQLDALPGVGPVLAERIVAYRERKGGFRNVGELRQVEGIGDAKFEQIKDLVTV
ncbi:MAG: ComEA family DNA-binding protein [Hamadaea sp.]|uniref:ComEA family DNA-binding protein n=1 Tax=Hamadaea sp. TaxID=2024425 RepID=UPI00184F9F47|nr:ComEA family DNA-binding protein [Hamadaea sp.]NUT24031.1 ComEA family DNA-binding protein [Hamadaea sp.]